MYILCSSKATDFLHSKLITMNIINVKHFFFFFFFSLCFLTAHLYAIVSSPFMIASPALNLGEDENPGRTEVSSRLSQDPTQV